MPARSPLMSTYLPQPVAFERGDGAHLFDAGGKRYLDCLAGIAVNTLGHNHPRLVATTRWPSPANDGLEPAYWESARLAPLPAVA